MARKYRRRRMALLLALMLVLFLVPTLLAALYASSNGPDGASESASETRSAGAPSRGAGEDGSSRGGRTGSGPQAGLTGAPPPAPAESCDDLRVLVDRNHPLPAGYAPDDLVPLGALGVPTLDGAEMLLREDAARQLGRLVRTAAADGEELVVASAYRSYGDQMTTFQYYTQVYGAGAEEVSAPPGHSQHQLGTAVDFTNGAAGYQLHWPFGDTTASLWLQRNAHRYGYVLAYPGGADTAETGYQWEPWHYRFIGVGNARRWRASGLSLQQFLAREGVLPLCGTTGDGAVYGAG
jgi:LAS superfamily LD-carboxypeptidase LdcB